MPTPTYTPLATVTLGSSASSVSFASIPASYRDLILVANGSASAEGDLLLRFNSDSGSNYNFVYMYGSFNGAISGASSSQTSALAGVVSTAVSSTIAQIMDYSATDKHKTVLTRTNRIPDIVLANAARWANTAAITTVLAFPASGTFSSGMTISLYGVIA
jgi:hypothetical protein